MCRSDSRALLAWRPMNDAVEQTNQSLPGCVKRPREGQEKQMHPFEREDQGGRRRYN